MTEELRKLLQIMNSSFNYIEHETMGSWGHEYNSHEFRPFSPNQFEEKEIKTLKPLIDDFLSAVNEEEKQKFFDSVEYHNYLNMFDPIQDVTGEFAPNYAIVIINNRFYLLTNQFYRSAIREHFLSEEYYVCKDLIDIYLFVNILAHCKGVYYIGTDNYDYYINKKSESEDKIISKIQIGESKNDLLEVVLYCDIHNENVYVNFNDTTIKVESNKPFMITKDIQCYCNQVKLTSNGFEVIKDENKNDNSSYIYKAAMYPDLSVLKSDNFTNTIYTDINCSDLMEKWYDKKEKEYKSKMDLRNRILDEKIEKQKIYQKPNIDNDGDMPW